MDLYREILADILSKGEIRVTFPELEIDAGKAVEMRCCNALQKIKAVISDDSLDDGECFMKIEEIIRVFEEMGCGCGGRHDF